MRRTQGERLENRKTLFSPADEYFLRNSWTLQQTVLETITINKYLHFPGTLAKDKVTENLYRIGIIGGIKIKLTQFFSSVYHKQFIAHLLGWLVFFFFFLQHLKRLSVCIYICISSFHINTGTLYLAFIFPTIKCLSISDLLWKLVIW